MVDQLQGMVAKVWLKIEFYLTRSWFVEIEAKIYDTPLQKEETLEDKWFLLC